MGSEKRERQKSARLAKIEEEERAARRARRNRLAIRTAVAAVVIVGGLFLYTVIAGDDGDETAAEDGESSTTAAETTSSTFTNPELAEEVLAREAPDPAPPPADTAPDALEREVLIEGQGDGAVAGDMIVAHYVGKLADGSVFDSSWERGEPMTLPAPLGQGGVIVGWDEGLVGARVGDRIRLVIGSEKAYGAQPPEGGPIPPNAPLAFEIDIVDVIPADAAAGGSTTAPAG